MSLLKKSSQCIFSLVIGGVCLGVDPPPNSIDELKSKALAIEKTFREQCAKIGYSHSEPANQNNVRVVPFQDENYEENTIELRSNDYWIGFIPRTGRLLGLEDYNIVSKQFHQNAPSFPTPNKPTWPPEKAVALAKPFFDLFLRNQNAFFASPGAKYEHTVLNKEGFWEVIWPRTDSKGHPFEYNEYVSVSISESKGPYGLTVCLSAHYEEQTGEPLKAVAVQDKALEVAKKTLTWGPVKGMLDPGHFDPKPFITQLKVVKPNHLLDHHEVNTHPDLNARLAWVFWYAWRLDNNPKQIQGVSVWIDAYTGDILGGDAAMN